MSRSNEWHVESIGMTIKADGAFIIVETVGHKDITHALVVSHSVRLHVECRQEVIVFCIEDGNTRLKHQSSCDNPYDIHDEVVHALMQAKHVARAYDRGR